MMGRPRRRLSTGNNSSLLRSDQGKDATLNTHVKNILLNGTMACTLAILALGTVSATAQTTKPAAAKADPNAVTAIDILLEPDATHRPHITLVQRFVLTKNLDKVYAAVGKVFAGANVTGLKLEAFKYYYIPDKDLGLSGIVIKPTPELIKLEMQVIDAVTPFAEKTGTSAAFVTGDVPEVLPALITYVSEFVPKSSGEHYHPHVTTGLAPKEYLDKMLAEPFETFTFSPAGAAVYHLGHFGTAAKKLKEWDLKP